MTNTETPVSPAGAETSAPARPAQRRQRQTPPTVNRRGRIVPVGAPRAPAPAPQIMAAPSLMMLPCDVPGLMAQVRQVIREELAAAAERTSPTRLYTNESAATYFYGDHPRAQDRWRSLRHYHPWIDTFSEGRGRLRTWTAAALENIASRLGSRSAEEAPAKEAR